MDNGTDNFKVIYPTHGLLINHLEIDTVDEEQVYGLCFTESDVQRGYTRWKTMMEAPDPFTHEFTDPALVDLVQRIATKEADKEAMRIELNIVNERNLVLVGDVADRERQIRELESKLNKLEADYKIVKELSDKREVGIKNLTRRVERFTEAQKRQLTSTISKNFIQRFAKRLFRI